MIVCKTFKEIEITVDSLYECLNEVKPGECLSKSPLRFKICEANGFSIVREYVGHGVGKDLHEDPDIPHYGSLTTIH